MKLKCVLNAQAVEIETAPDRRVVDLLREDLGLVGTKEGCGTGECGACTILVNGQTRLSCLMIAAQLEGQDVMTVEGLADTEDGAAVQRAFVDNGAVQCGFCIPGMELTALALVREHTLPERTCIREGLSGNLCRCTGYSKIIDAVERATHALVKDEKP